MYAVYIYRYLREEEEIKELQKDDFLSECLGDPSLRDEYALISRSFKNRLGVRQMFYLKSLL